MKPFELFKLLCNAKSREEFISILRKNRIPLNTTDKKASNTKISTH
jgi:hypothetical protein